MNLVLLTTMVALAAATPAIKEQWASFKRQHGKSYHSIEEEKFRMNIFTDNLKKIEEHNAKYEAGQETFYLGMNYFGDMLPEEIYVSKFNETQEKNKLPRFEFSPPANAEIPESIDWRDLGAVTPIKNQGLFCGSCWAFSSTGAIEGQLFRKTGKLVSLSEQQLVDCTRTYNNHGCDGGYAHRSFKYLQDVEGLESEDSYPYEGKDRYCRYRKDKVVPGTKVKGYVNIKWSDDDELKAAVANVGPVSIGISADGFLFAFYRGGVFTGIFCSRQIDHEVLLVGYGTGILGEYWIIKNSWGRLWGNWGYMKMSTRIPNNCGISSDASYPILE